jgi:AcrR family transcriptional regulator
MSKKKPPGIRAQRKAARPLEILDAAFEEFVANGYAATRVEDIAARTGVTKGTVYFYFETKEALFEEMIRHISVPFTDVTDHMQTLTGPCSERLRTFVKLVYERIATDRNSRELLRFVISEGSRFPQVVDRHYEQSIAPMFSAARTLLEEGVAAGEFRETPLLKIPEIALSPMLLMSVWLMIFGERQPRDMQAFINTHIDLLLHGVLASPDEAKPHP